MAMQEKKNPNQVQGIPKRQCKTENETERPVESAQRPLTLFARLAKSSLCDTRVPNLALPGPGTNIHVRQCYHSNQRIRFYTYQTTLGFVPRT